MSTLTDLQLQNLLSALVGGLFGMVLQNCLDYFREKSEWEEEQEAREQAAYEATHWKPGRNPPRKPLREMDNHELMADAVRLDRLWAQFTNLADDEDYPGHCCSPGESLHEDLIACQRELTRRGLSWPFAGATP